VVGVGVGVALGDGVTLDLTTGAGVTLLGDTLEVTGSFLGGGSLRGLLLVPRLSGFMVATGTVALNGAGGSRLLLLGVLLLLLFKPLDGCIGSRG
jgi:hypothetical protein